MEKGTGTKVTAKLKKAFKAKILALGTIHGFLAQKKNEIWRRKCRKQKGFNRTVQETK